MLDGAVSNFSENCFFLEEGAMSHRFARYAKCRALTMCWIALHSAIWRTRRYGTYAMLCIARMLWMARMLWRYGYLENKQVLHVC